MFLKHLSQNFKRIGLKHWVTTSCQLEGPVIKSETLTTANAGERVEQRELSFTAGGDHHGAGPREDGSVVSPRTTHSSDRPVIMLLGNYQRT